MWHICLQTSAARSDAPTFTLRRCHKAREGRRRITNPRWRQHLRTVRVTLWYCSLKCTLFVRQEPEGQFQPFLSETNANLRCSDDTVSSSEKSFLRSLLNGRDENLKGKNTWDLWSDVRRAPGRDLLGNFLRCASRRRRRSNGTADVYVQEKIAWIEKNVFCSFTLLDMRAHRRTGNLLLWTSLLNFFWCWTPVDAQVRLHHMIPVALSFAPDHKMIGVKQRKQKPTAILYRYKNEAA